MNLPKDIEFLDVNAADQWVTNYDVPDLPDNFILEGRGVRPQESKVLLRDFGSKHRYANYPSKPSAITIINGFTFFDVATGAEKEIVFGLDTSNYPHVYVNDSSLSSANPGTANDWIELTRVFTANINGNPGAASKTANINTGKDSLQAAYTFATDDELNGFIAWRVSATANLNKFAYITDSNATSVTSDVILGSTGLAWADGDKIVLIRDNGWMDQLFATTGTNPPTAASINVDLDAELLAGPHIRWNPVEAQKKVNLYWGSSATIPVMRTPLRLERKSARNYFYIAAGTPLLSVPSNWYLEKGGGGLCPYHGTKGTVKTPIDTGTPTSDVAAIEDKTGNVFLRLSYTITEDVSTVNPVGMRVIMTLVYDNYQESDPVYRWYLRSSGGNSPRLNIDSLKVCFARMNKSITGVRFYAATATQATIDVGWTDSDAEYGFVLSFSFIADEWSWNDGGIQAYDATVYWALDSTSEYCYALSCAAHIGSGLLRNTSLSLGHTSDTSRAYQTPRYACRVARSQGALSVIDGNDGTLYLSTYDGYGVNGDDNFIDVTVDNSANRTKIFLNGLGELMGLAVMNDVIYAFRRREYETYDLQSGVQKILPCDFASKRSLVSTTRGLFWAGDSGIYWLPSAGGEAIPITQTFGNWYNGTLMIDNGTGSSPYLTKAFREAIIGGFDPTFQEVWFHTEANEDTEFGGSTEFLCLRYNVKTERWLPPRELAIAAAVKYFSQNITDTNGSHFTIGYASGLLRYPLKSSSSYLYKDGVSTTDTGGTAITTRLTINVGSIYGLVQNAVLGALWIDQIADVSAGVNAMFHVELFANNETIAFETKKQAASWRTITRMLPPRGQLERLKVRLSLPAASTINRWEVSKLSLGLKRQLRIGNR